MKKTLGERIAEKRKARGLKQDELAEMLGISAQAVSKWENDVSCPDIMTLPLLPRSSVVRLMNFLRERRSPRRQFFCLKKKEKNLTSLYYEL